MDLDFEDFLDDLLQPPTAHEVSIDFNTDVFNEDTKELAELSRVPISIEDELNISKDANLDVIENLIQEIEHELESCQEIEEGHMELTKGNKAEVNNKSIQNDVEINAVLAHEEIEVDNMKILKGNRTESDNSIQINEDIFVDLADVDKPEIDGDVEQGKKKRHAEIIYDNTNEAKKRKLSTMEFDIKHYKVIFERTSESRNTTDEIAKGTKIASDKSSYISEKINVDLADSDSCEEIEMFGGQEKRIDRSDAMIDDNINKVYKGRNLIMTDLNSQPCGVGLERMTGNRNISTRISKPVDMEESNQKITNSTEKSGQDMIVDKNKSQETRMNCMITETTSNANDNCKLTDTNKFRDFDSNLNVIKNPKHECKICFLRLKSAYSLRFHMLIHTNKLPYQCTICKRSFRIQSTLTRHFRTHTGEKPYECQVCKRKFVCVSGLRKHERRYHDFAEAPRILSGAALTLHLRRVEKHSLEGKKNFFECSICQIPFLRKSSLIDHMKQHTIERSYECKICSETFPNLYDFHTHKTKMHENVEIQTKPSFRCNVCGKVYQVNKYFIEHMKKHMKRNKFKRRYKCSVCSGDITTLRATKIHLRVHHPELFSIISDPQQKMDAICELAKACKKEVIKKVVEKEPIICSVCNKICKSHAHLTGHMRSHTKEKPFACRICLTTFTAADQRRSHERRMHKGLIITTFDVEQEKRRRAKVLNNKTNEVKLVLTQFNIKPCRVTLERNIESRIKIDEITLNPNIISDIDVSDDYFNLNNIKDHKFWSTFIDPEDKSNKNNNVAIKTKHNKLKTTVNPKIFDVLEGLGFNIDLSQRNGRLIKNRIKNKNRDLFNRPVKSISHDKFDKRLKAHNHLKKVGKITQEQYKDISILNFLKPKDSSSETPMTTTKPYEVTLKYNNIETILEVY